MTLPPILTTFLITSSRYLPLRIDDRNLLTSILYLSRSLSQENSSFIFTYLFFVCLVPLRAISSYQWLMLKIKIGHTTYYSGQKYVLVVISADGQVQYNLLSRATFEFAALRRSDLPFQRKYSRCLASFSFVKPIYSEPGSSIL